MRGSLRQRSKGSWELRWEVRGPNGERDYRSCTVKGTKKAAQAKLNEILHALDTGSYVDPAKQTLGEYLERQWLPGLSATHAPKTRDGYARFVKNQIAPRLGKLLLSQVTPAVIQTWLGELRESGGCDGEGLAANSVIHAWTTLSAALSAAVDLGLIPTNPARRTRLPRVEQPEIVILTAAEVIHLLQAVRGDVIEPAVLLAAYAGLRRGECLGLRWADVNLKDGWAMVRRSRYVIPGEIGTKGPKTGKSRGIPLAEPARERLAEIVQEQAAGRLALSLPAEGEGWVCCHADGRPLRPDTLSHRFTLLRERAGLPAVTFHGLRHSCATLLLSLGVPSRVIADLLGHSSTTMTDQVYAHVTQEVLSDAVRRLGENLGSGGQP